MNDRERQLVCLYLHFFRKRYPGPPPPGTRRVFTDPKPVNVTGAAIQWSSSPATPDPRGLLEAFINETKRATLALSYLETAAKTFVVKHKEAEERQRQLAEAVDKVVPFETRDKFVLHLHADRERMHRDYRRRFDEEE